MNIQLLKTPYRILTLGFFKYSSYHGIFTILGVADRVVAPDWREAAKNRSDLRKICDAAINAV